VSALAPIIGPLLRAKSSMALTGDNPFWSSIRCNVDVALKLSI
jgi:hypothetical protein